MRAHSGMYVVLSTLAVAAPFLGLYPVFLMKLLCFAMFACAFNLLLGYTKMLSFGHAAYFGSPWPSSCSSSACKRSSPAARMACRVFRGAASSG